LDDESALPCGVLAPLVERYADGRGVDDEVREYLCT